jgi:hypothetical protein
MTGYAVPDSRAARAARTRRASQSELGQSRRESHNTHFDDDLVRAGRCGNVHLATGASCRLPAMHRGGCEFSPRPVASGADRSGAVGPATDNEQGLTDG